VNDVLIFNELDASQICETLNEELCASLTTLLLALGLSLSAMENFFDSPPLSASLLQCLVDLCFFVLWSRIDGWEDRRAQNTIVTRPMPLPTGI
jgi:hypothetical protein